MVLFGLLITRVIFCYVVLKGIFKMMQSHEKSDRGYLLKKDFKYIVNIQCRKYQIKPCRIINYDEPNNTEKY